MAVEQKGERVTVAGSDLTHQQQILRRVEFVEVHSTHACSRALAPESMDASRCVPARARPRYRSGREKVKDAHELCQSASGSFSARTMCTAFISQRPLASGCSTA